MVPLLLLLLPHPSRRQAKWCLLVGTAWLPSRQQPKNRRCVQALGPVVSAKAMCGGTASLRLCMLIGCGETQHSMKCQHRSQHVSHWPRDLCMCQSSSGLDHRVFLHYCLLERSNNQRWSSLMSCRLQRRQRSQPKKRLPNSQRSRAKLALSKDSMPCNITRCILFTCRRHCSNSASAGC